MSKFNVRGGVIVRDFPRVDAAIIEELGKAPTSILSDCMGRLQVLDPALKPLIGERRWVGSAFTVEEVEGGNLMSHLALSYVQPGDVLVIDGKGVTTRASWGGLQAFAAKQRGVRALVLDGAVRDAKDAEKYDFPTYCRAVCPAGPHKGWPGRVNLPVSVGGLAIQPGDVIVGDSDGVVVVPRLEAEATLARVRAKLAQERDWFERVERGENTADFLGFAGLIEEFGIEVR